MKIYIVDCTNSKIQKAFSYLERKGFQLGFDIRLFQHRFEEGNICVYTNNLRNEIHFYWDEYNQPPDNITYEELFERKKLKIE